VRPRLFPGAIVIVIMKTGARTDSIRARLIGKMWRDSEIEADSKRESGEKVPNHGIILE
jgi:hypothetical protein